VQNKLGVAVDAEGRICIPHGKNRGEHLKRRHWLAFALECGLNGPRLVKRVEDLANRALREVGPAAAEVDAMPAGTHVLMPKFVEAIEGRARAILAGASDDGDGEERPVDTSVAVPKPASKPRKKKAKAAAR
jgi:serine/threonine-protein kinase HipA